MNYCLRYNDKSEQLNNVQEISILYNKQDRSLIDYLAANYLTRTVLRVTNVARFIEDEDWRILNAIAKQYPQYNFTVCFCFNQSLRDCPKDIFKLDCLNFPWFVDCPIVDWDSLHFVVDAKVSDVYICEALAFELPQVYRLCSFNNVKVRIYPNVAQSSIKTTELQSAFFIRPEDIDAYEPYIDVLEFYGPIEKQDVLLHIYRNTKTWPYDLSVIILGLPPMQNTIIPRTFGATRVECGKECLRGGWCNVCKHLSTVDKFAREVNAQFTPWNKH